MKKYQFLSIAALLALSLLCGTSPVVAKSAGSGRSIGFLGGTNSSAGSRQVGSIILASRDDVPSGGGPGTMTGKCALCTDGGTPTPPPPPPPPCTLTVDTPVVQVGTSTVRLSWWPQPIMPVVPKGIATSSVGSGINLVRVVPGNKSLVVPTQAETYTDSFFVKTEGINAAWYSLNYPTHTNPYTKTYATTTTFRVYCSISLKAVARLTECNDGIDNADPEDALIDQQDPACHRDGNPANTGSYVATTTSETNPATNLAATVSVSSPFNYRATVTVRATSTNTSLTWAPANDFVLAYRVLGQSCSGSQCITHKGTSYTKLAQNTNVYMPKQSSVLTSPLWLIQPGSYEICAFADEKNSVIETSKADNDSCITRTVTSNGPNVVVSIQKQGETVWHSAVTIKAGEQVNVQWVPDNTARSCRATVSAWFKVKPEDGSAGMTTTVQEPTAGSRAYAVECADAKGNLGVGSASAALQAFLTPPTLSVSPTRVKRGSTATLTWNTGGRTKCTINGANGQVIDLTGAASASSANSSPITAETKYTLSCLDDNTSAQSIVKLLPQYQEI